MSDSTLLAAGVQPLVITRAWASLLSIVLLLGFGYLSHVVIKGRGRRLADSKEISRKGATRAVAEQVTFRRRGIKSAVIGSDGRASTSKVQPVLWTLAVFYALVFLLLWGRSTGCEEGNSSPACIEAAEGREALLLAVNTGLQPEYYVLLGFPFAAALAARAMTGAKVADGTLEKPPIQEDQGGVIQGLAEIVSDDSGETDLMDLQYFAFNLLALAFFFFEFLGNPSGGLPEVPPTLIALAGLSSATYTVKKALENKSSEVGG